MLENYVDLVSLAMSKTTKSCLFFDLNKIAKFLTILAIKNMISASTEMVKSRPSINVFWDEVNKSLPSPHCKVI